MLVPKVMSTQHPDNATPAPFADDQGVLKGDGEVDEAVDVFALGCDEQMWDSRRLDGKRMNSRRHMRCRGDGADGRRRRCGRAGPWGADHSVCGPPGRGSLPSVVPIRWLLQLLPTEPPIAGLSLLAAPCSRCCPRRNSACCAISTSATGSRSRRCACCARRRATCRCGESSASAHGGMAPRGAAERRARPRGAGSQASFRHGRASSGSSRSCGSISTACGRRRLGTGTILRRCPTARRCTWYRRPRATPCSGTARCARNAPCAAT